MQLWANTLERRMGCGPRWWAARGAPPNPTRVQTEQVSRRGLEVASVCSCAFFSSPPDTAIGIDLTACVEDHGNCALELSVTRANVSQLKPKLPKDLEPLNIERPCWVRVALARSSTPLTMRRGKP